MAKTEKKASKPRNKALIDDAPPPEVTYTLDDAIAHNNGEDVHAPKVSGKAAASTEAPPAPAKKAGGSKVGAKKPKPEFRQPDEIVVGRYYEIEQRDEIIRGELVAINGTTQVIQVWEQGKPSERTEEVFFPNRHVREISREACFELTSVIV